MGDLVRWAMTWTDAAVVADIATHMAATNMSGQDFLGLNDTELQTWGRFTVNQVNNNSFITL